LEARTAFEVQGQAVAEPVVAALPPLTKRLIFEMERDGVEVPLERVPAGIKVAAEAFRAYRKRSWRVVVARSHDRRRARAPRPRSRRSPAHRSSSAASTSRAGPARPRGPDADRVARAVQGRVL
jgi:hypothetical protein